jgi:hypothetical protein
MKKGREKGKPDKARVTARPHSVQTSHTRMLGNSPVTVARLGHGGEGERVLLRTPVAHSVTALAFYSGGESRIELRGGEWTVAAGDILLVPAGGNRSGVGLRQTS